MFIIKEDKVKKEKTTLDVKIPALAPQHNTNPSHNTQKNELKSMLTLPV